MPSITVEPAGVTVMVREGETILEGLYRHGYAYTVGCRRGGCAICKVELRSGTVGYTRIVAEAVLSPAERDSGICLTCRATPESDITIRMREDELRMVNPILARNAGSSDHTSGRD